MGSTQRPLIRGKRAMSVGVRHGEAKRATGEAVRQVRQLSTQLYKSVKPLFYMEVGGRGYEYINVRKTASLPSLPHPQNDPSQPEANQ